MKIIDGELAQKGNIIESILVKSYEDYKKMGGTRSKFDAYHELMSRAERLENKSLELMDMSLSGFDIDSAEIHAVANAAQAMYALIFLWFNVSFHKVCYANYILPKHEDYDESE